MGIVVVVVSAVLVLLVAVGWIALIVMDASSDSLVKDSYKGTVDVGVIKDGYGHVLGFDFGSFGIAKGRIQGTDYKYIHDMNSYLYTAYATRSNYTNEFCRWRNRGERGDYEDCSDWSREHRRVGLETTQTIREVARRMEGRYDEASSKILADTLRDAGMLT